MVLPSCPLGAGKTALDDKRIFFVFSFHCWEQVHQSTTKQWKLEPENSQLLTMETSAIDPDRRQAALPLPVAQTRPVRELGDGPGEGDSGNLGIFKAWSVYPTYIHIIYIYI